MVKAPQKYLKYKKIKLIIPKCQTIEMDDDKLSLNRCMLFRIHLQPIVTNAIKAKVYN